MGGGVSMDVETMAATIAVVKKMPDNAANSAQRAEDAADRAEEYGQRITIQNNTLVIGGDE